MDGQALREAALGDLSPQERMAGEAAIKAFGLTWEQIAHDARQCARQAVLLLERSDVDEGDAVAAVAIAAYAQGVFLTLVHLLGRVEREPS